MPVERMAGGASLVDVLDRLLDRGLRFDARTPLDPGRAALMEDAARIVVAFSEVRTADSPERGPLSPRPPSPGA
jgi:gas vesicle structural protein